MKTTMRAHRDAAILKEAADRMSKTIYVRTYKHGSSNDIKRKSTYREHDWLRNLMYATLLSLNESEYVRSDTEAERAILSTAEHTLLTFAGELKLPERYTVPGNIDYDINPNTYLTIYCPLMDYIRAWRAESKQI